MTNTSSLPQLPIWKHTSGEGDTEKQSENIQSGRENKGKRLVQEIRDSRQITMQVTSKIQT
jgi:hypothetical protein